MANWLRILLAVVVGAHGVGHVLFLASSLGLADWGQSTRSWLLGDGGLARGLGSLLWVLAVAGFVAAAIGLFGESDWWRTLAIVSALISIVGLILYWASPATSPAISAFVFNLLVLGALVVLNWPAAAYADR